MSPQVAGVLQLTALIAALALAYRPLGDHMAKVYSSEKHYTPEKWPRVNVLELNTALRDLTR
ncbi:hypothetical protein WQO_22190 [Streptomyces globisporus C-1027]|uniref:Uncharacterized protein n=1 Tax=Streptomyces globisporus C-1027 TaxID=1172567 RepID=A0A0U3LHW1_STRGL|nr:MULTISPECIES: potassium-transporting ATPase subunit A [Streptomyces]ALU95788.1 hypothetical protein WQO_22190 [Streptomyces globisporus C-1027]OKJ30354.1 hypothetical protein AMK23_02705 [Streptomyces sp. CB02130]